MSKCYYCGRTDGTHDISCICNKKPDLTDYATRILTGDSASSPAMNAASQPDADDLLNQRWSKESDMIQSWSGQGSADMSEADRAEGEQARAELAAMPLSEVVKLVQGSATSGEADEYSSREAAVLRRLLAWRVSGGLLYADDGELQDNTAWPHIDFKRDTVDTIESKLGERTRTALAAKAEQATRRGEVDPLQLTAPAKQRVTD